MRIALKIISLVLVLAACSTKKSQIQTVVHLNSRIEGDQFIDSLISNGTDSLIAYYSGCSDCSRNFNRQYAIYWYSEGHWNLRKFTSKARYQTLKDYEPPMAYLMANRKSIADSSLNSSNYVLSAYAFELIRIQFASQSIEYRIKDYERLGNEEHPKVQLIDQMRSALQKIPSESWKSGME
ncbi:hypothetical protein [Croceimicrobium hydrocarbonivorans]|uniref:Lipoprotein n=1 Tax=Croceimicrobium hydrocarbonivorans TaxID=2761580 RepID=A0A7H0VDQ4_9FLAO|nr:hypothetical protein [Croceimicrobium hydrocarbonivorans]QNR23852.1 hypothetical protein H4K34_15970 [Croceimicrobium hydrocarbonivorans]